MSSAIPAVAILRSALAVESARMALIYGCALALIAAGRALPALG